MKHTIRMTHRMKRLLLFPVVILLGCEGIGSAYNAMSAGTQALLMVAVTIAFALTAWYVLPKRVYFTQTE